MQQVGNVAIKPEPHLGQHEHFSNDDFSAFSSKIPLVGEGFGFFFAGVGSVEDGSARADTSVELKEISVGFSSLLSSDDEILSSPLLPLVLDSDAVVLPGRFHPPDALRRFDSNVLVGFQVCLPRALSWRDMLLLLVVAAVGIFWDLLG